MSDRPAQRSGVHDSVPEPFETLPQQRQADKLGMYLFLATEVMLFGGLFAVLFVTRLLHPQETIAASKLLHVWIGTANTAVLLTSSLAVALGVTFARIAKARPAAYCLAVAAGLGIVFLALKAIEYVKEYDEGLLPVTFTAHFDNAAQHLFMNLYLIATGLHALHVSIGIVLLSGLAWRMERKTLALPRESATVEASGLYWHLVDAVWIFLYPVLYLAR